MTWKRATTRSLLFALLAPLSGACGGPIAHPRTATVQRNGEVGMRWSVSAYAVEVSARVAADPNDPTAQEGRVDSRSQPGAMLLAQTFILPVTSEGQPSVGIADGLEVSGIASLRRFGVEMRGQLLDERTGSPLSLALSGATLFGWLVGPKGIGGRVGLDASGDAGNVIWIAGTYAGYIPNSYEFGDESWARHGDWGGEADVEVRRRELRLSVPLAISIPTRRRQAAFVIGVVPEWTLGSENEHSECKYADACYARSGDEFIDLPVTDFTQRFELFVTLGLEIGTLDDPNAPATATTGRPQAF